MTVFFLLKCLRDESNETTGQIMPPVIIKTESQLIDEEYKADLFSGKDLILFDCNDTYFN